MFATSCLTLPITSLKSRFVCLCARAGTNICVHARACVCVYVGVRVCGCVSIWEQRVVIHSAVGVMRHVCRQCAFSVVSSECCQSITVPFRSLRYKILAKAACCLLHIITGKHLHIYMNSARSTLCSFISKFTSTLFFILQMTVNQLFCSKATSIAELVLGMKLTLLDDTFCNVIKMPQTS